MNGCVVAGINPKNSAKKDTGSPWNTGLNKNIGGGMNAGRNPLPPLGKWRNYLVKSNGP